MRKGEPWQLAEPPAPHPSGPLHPASPPQQHPRIPRYESLSATESPSSEGNTFDLLRK